MDQIHLELTREEQESPEYRRYLADTDYPFADEDLLDILAKWDKSRRHKKDEE